MSNSNTESLPTSTLLTLQSALIDFSEQFARLQASLSLEGLSLHLSPDGCWISEEHDVDKHDDVDLENGIHNQYEVFTRRSPMCHRIITKI